MTSIGLLVITYQHAYNVWQIIAQNSASVMDEGFHWHCHHCSRILFFKIQTNVTFYIFWSWRVKIITLKSYPSFRIMTLLTFHGRIA